MDVSTERLYDGAADGWKRATPILLSDFTARPFLLEWCEPVRDRRVLDLGCGEGYVARQLADRGATAVFGIDVSEKMVEKARDHEATHERGIEYAHGDATDLSAHADETFDLVVAVFMFNYMDRAAMTRAMVEIHRVLRPGGTFVFSVPHPSLPFLRDREEPFYFESGSSGYFSGRDVQMEGRIWRRDGESVPVRCVHKTFDDYFKALRAAGFDRLPDVEELHVTEDHIGLDPEFFGPLEDTPLHAAFRIRKGA